ncbi:MULTISPECIES: hypothetical protein [Bacillales]|uniref:hypothetical protein n=1 Tax=Bacillales TaxID=1385 RepID=UPI001883CD9A|nr:hypothetical protein [Pseudalkalibacillus hwajinpoensis]MBF0707565.1 hypothetical protein [Pseudalkalibacillus hwajinpoensis]
MESRKHLLSEPYWMINTLGLMLFILVGMLLILNDNLIAFTIVAVCYGFAMFIGNSLYRSYRKRKQNNA